MRRPLWAFAVLMLLGCASEESKRAHARIEDFTTRCPKPEWWDRVSTGGFRIATYQDLMEYWRDDDRTESQFFKAAYQAILDHPLDDDIVANAVNLLPNGDESYPYTIQLLEFGLDHTSDYRRPLNNYMGKIGDTTAVTAEELAGLYNQGGRYADAASLVERVLAKREHEINDQLLELLSLEYAEALYEMGYPDRAIQVLDEAIREYDGDWEKRLREQVARYR